MEQVSVIMPVYNGRNTMQMALDSILQQDYRPIQVIVVDDASDDDSYAFAKAYSQKTTDTRVEIIVLKNDINKGAGETRNLALQHATGHYISFLDADDLWKPHKLTVQVTAMRDCGASVCYSAYDLFRDQPERPIAIQKVFSLLTFDRLCKANYIGNLTGIYDAQAIGKVPIPDMRKRQDWAMWLDVLKLAGPAIGIKETLASYRLGAGLSASKMGLISYNFAIYNDHLGYNWLKSVVCLGRFFIEQYLVKRWMRRYIG
jgi:glycosyltransferase involved in cell wall biosynthesis